MHHTTNASQFKMIKKPWNYTHSMRSSFPRSSRIRRGHGNISIAAIRVASALTALALALVGHCDLFNQHMEKRKRALNVKSPREFIMEKLWSHVENAVFQRGCMLGLNTMVSKKRRWRRTWMVLWGAGKLLDSLIKSFTCFLETISPVSG